VLGKHRRATAGINTNLAPHVIVESARGVWDEACERAASFGVRNSQATVLAPTGTIGLLMDCDTTGIEPDLALVKSKQLVGGGTMQIVNQTIPRALRKLGYAPEAVSEITSHVAEKRTVEGSSLAPEHRDVFACSLGDGAISAAGPIKMMGAVQPFISGAISKTVNMPASATVEDVEQLFVQAWQLGLKAVAIYRDNSKVAQPLSATAAGTSNSGTPPAEATLRQDTAASNGAGHTSSTNGAGTLPPAEIALEVASQGVPVRQRLQRSRVSRTFEFRVADCKGFVTVGEYPDGRPGEIFVKVSKQGSTLAGIMDAFAISVSHGLQYGVPLSAYVETFVGVRFEPAGITDDPDIRIATSLMDYLFRKLAVMYLSADERADLGVYTTGERTQPTLPGVEEHATVTAQGQDLQTRHDTPLQQGSKGHHHTQTQLSEQVRGGMQSRLDFESRDGRGFQTESQAREDRHLRGDAGAPFCMTCGVTMRRAGSCYVCSACGATSGCS